MSEFVISSLPRRRREAILSRVHLVPVTINISHITDDVLGIAAKIDAECLIVGNLDIDERKAEIESFGVASSLRRRGLGTRLIMAFTAMCKQEGAVELRSDELSSAALHLRKKVFGEERLRIYEPNHLEYGFLPMTFEEAISSVGRSESKDVRTRDLGAVGVSIDLLAVDTTGWH
jgi:GNAT superfamily N-acetyltransferase